MASEQAAKHGEPAKTWPDQVMGGKYFRLLQKQLDNLRDDSPHGNRQLFLDDVFVVYLRAFFNATIRSLRLITNLLDIEARLVGLLYRARWREVIPILRERERRCELDRQSRARHQAKQKS